MKVTYDAADIHLMFKFFSLQPNRTIRCQGWRSSYQGRIPAGRSLLPSIFRTVHHHTVLIRPLMRLFTSPARNNAGN